MSLSYGIQLFVKSIRCSTENSFCKRVQHDTDTGCFEAIENAGALEGVPHTAQAVFLCVCHS